jgi:hypothetical protein
MPMPTAIPSGGAGDSTVARSEPVDLSLPEFLAQRARNASDARLCLHTAVGLIAIAAAIVLARTGSLLLGLAGTCFVAFGSWGIADRELAERRPAISWVGAAALLIVRGGAGLLGLVAALALLFGGLAIMLGTVIS